MTADETVLSLTDDQRRDVMKAPDEVSAMLRLKALGWGSKRIAAELGCARNTVRRWLNEGDWRACASASRSKKLDGLSDWIAERFHRHAGNADVVRQELAFEKGLVVSLRTAERATAPLRRELVAFRAFGGVPREVLLDNAKALILHHDPASREVVLHPRLHAFARHWGFRIRACAPYRARTKGKDERGVGYVKRNAIAGRRFATWSEMEAHLEKTHLAVAIGREAIVTGYTVLFTPATTLVAQLAKAHADGRLDERLAHYAKPKLLIVDELGYLPFEPNAAHLFFQLVSRRYERGAMLVTSNRAVGEWGSVFGDPVVATAILDRLLHHSHVLTIRGDSYRLREKRRSGLLQKTTPTPETVPA